MDTWFRRLAIFKKVSTLNWRNFFFKQVDLPMALRLSFYTKRNSLLSVSRKSNPKVYH